jgi:hypothetical protein
MISIDRFEDEYAILDKDGVIVCVEKYALPDNAREGDVLLIDEHGNFVIAEDETSEWRGSLMDRLHTLCSEGDDESADSDINEEI